MALFYFDVNECGVITNDEEGRSCDTLDDAVAYAMTIARGIMAAEVTIGKLCLSCCVEIHDADRVLIQKMPFRFAIDVTGLGSDD